MGTLSGKDKGCQKVSRGFLYWSYINYLYHSNRSWVIRGCNTFINTFLAISGLSWRHWQERKLPIEKMPRSQNVVKKNACYLSPTLRKFLLISHGYLMTKSEIRTIVPGQELNNVTDSISWHRSCIVYASNFFWFSFCRKNILKLHDLAKKLSIGGNIVFVFIFFSTFHHHCFMN